MSKLTSEKTKRPVENTAKFEILASKRVTNVLVGLRRLSKLASKNYAFNTAHVNQISTTLTTEMERTLQRFRDILAGTKTAPETQSFHFEKE